MKYDKTIFDKYRALAITDRDKLVIGQRYWSNYNESFILLGFRKSETGQWWMITDPRGFGCYYIYQYCQSCTDRNIGASYNPWLLFDSKDVCESCKKELVIEFGGSYVLDHEWEED